MKVGMFGRAAVVLGAVLMVSALAGCQTNPDTGNPTAIGPLPAAGVVAVNPAQTAEIQIVSAVPADATQVGTINGVSCKNTPLDPTPTEERALAQLKQKAADAGATGVAGITYKQGGTSLITNCWSTVTATGTAFR